MFKVITSKRQINEGDALTTNISGSKKGAKLYYRIVGSNVNKSDFSAGSITGTITGSKNGTAKISHRLKADKLTEGNESLRVQVYSDKYMKKLVGQSELVSVIDSSKRPASSKDPVTGMFADIEGLGRVQSDRVYSKGSALSTFFQNPHATKWEAEIEFGDRRFIAMTIRATEPTQTNHPTYVTRIVIEGDFKYIRNSLVSARVDRTAQVSDGPFGWGVINSYGGVNIRNPMSASSWGASLSNPGKVTASYETNNGVQTGDLAALNGFGGGKFFYGGWEANPFASSLI